MQMMPPAQEKHLQQVREQTRITILQDKEKFKRLLEGCMRGVQEKKAWIAKLEESVGSLKSDIPEAIEILKALVAQLPDL
jgi:hypothetical protein